MPLINKSNSPLIALFFIVLLSRIPFINAGYGVEEDSWGIALAAFHTKLTGIYEPSRLPGHPVQELIYSALWGTGEIVFNGLCALFSAISAVYFALILKHFQCKHFFIAALAFAFVPVYYISSTYTIDFVWTETFVLISLYALLKKRFIISGIFLGLAIGSRITSGAMLLPFMIIIWQQDNIKQNILNLLKIAIPTSLVTILAFIPIIQQFGFSFFMYYDQFPYPPITKVLYKMVLGVFGLVGTIAIIYFVLYTVLTKNKNHGNLFTNGLSKRVIIACYTIIILYIISYFRLPQKSGYMIPVIPFVILLLAYYANSKQFKTICIALIASSFVCSINLTDKIRGATHSQYAFVFNASGQELFFDPISGPIFSDYSKRKLKMAYTKSVREKANTTNEKTVVIAGWWYNEIMVESIEKNQNNFVTFEFYIDSEKIKNYLADGYKITYLSEQDKYNDLMYKMQLTNTIAIPF